MPQNTRTAVGEDPHAADSNSRVNVLLVVTSSDIGGTEKTIYELSRSLNRKLFNPTVCSLRPCETMAHEAALEGIPVFTLSMSEAPHLGEILRGAFKLQRYIDKVHIGLVQSFLYRANVTARLSAHLSRQRPCVVSSQRSLSSRRTSWALLADRWTQRLSDHTVAVSVAVKHDLVRTQGVDANKVTVIPNGVQPNAYEPLDSRSCKVALGVPAGSVLIGTVCRLSPEKGVTYLLEAFAVAKRHAPALSLIIVGDGPERPQLARQVRSTALEESVLLLGWRRALREVYSAIDILVLPSLEEGAPNVLLEAMASGCAVIATAVGEIPILVAHGSSGFLVPPADPGALAGAIALLARDPSLRQRLGCQARRQVRHSFNADRMVREYEQLYCKLLQLKKGTPA